MNIETFWCYVRAHFAVRMLQNRLVKLSMLLIVSLFASELIAAPINMGVYAITNNGAGSPAIGVAQIGITVDSVSATEVSFDVSNSGPLDFSIANIYFDDANSLFTGAIAITDAPPAVDFSVGGSPTSLPSGGTAVPAFSSDYTASANNPKPSRGVNAGESVLLTLTLGGGNDFDDVADAIASNDLRVGMHAISFPNGSSEGFVSFHVPEPSSLALAWLLGVAWIGPRLRR